MCSEELFTRRVKYLETDCTVVMQAVSSAKQRGRYCTLVVDLCNYAHI